MKFKTESSNYLFLFVAETSSHIKMNS